MSERYPFETIPEMTPYWWAHMWKQMREHQERVLTQTRQQEAANPAATHPDYVDRDGDLWLSQSRGAQVPARDHHFWPQPPRAAKVTKAVVPASDETGREVRNGRRGGGTAQYPG
jgi:hypothetical protein